MSRTKNQKTQLVEDYKEKIKGAKALFILEPKGMTANQSVEIKKNLYDLEAEFNVVKNSLFKIALEQLKYEIAPEFESNQRTIVFSGDKFSEAAKVIKTFIEENKDTLEIVTGYLDGAPIAKEDVKELADLPTRDVMLAQVLGTMNAPISGFVNVLAGNIRNLVNVIGAIKDQKEN